MNVNIESLLHDEIIRELEDLSGMDVGTDEYRKTIEGFTKLADKAIEIDKLNIETNEKEKAREMERELKEKQLEEQAKARELENNLKQQQFEDEKRDRLIKNCLTIAGLIIPSVITVWGTCKSIKFEETGTITTIMGRGFINKLLPKK